MHYIRSPERAGVWGRLTATALLLPIWVGASVPRSVRASAVQCPDGTPPPCGARRAPAPNSVAVLYFDNLSRDTADAYLADGLTEEIIIRLGQVPRVEVKSRFEVQRVRGRPVGDPVVLGRALNAAYLVTGSVQRVRERVRLRVALVRAASRAQVWGDVIDRASDDILNVESEIATAVASAVTGRLLPGERASLVRRLTSDPEAYDLYLRALRAADSWEETSLRAALSYLDRTLARDTAFAAAYAVKANVWATLADGIVAPLEGYSMSREAAERARRLDSSLALPYAMLANAALALDLDPSRAEVLARQALARDSRLADGWMALSQVHRLRGQVPEASSDVRRAWEADTLSANNSLVYMMTLLGTGRLDSVELLLPRMGSLLAEDRRQISGYLRFYRGDYAGAVEHLENWRRYGGFPAATRVSSLVALGRREAAQALVDSMLAARSGPGYFNPVALAEAFAVLGDTGRAFEWLERAFDERTIWVADAPNFSPFLAPLRAHPRWALLLRHYGLEAVAPARDR